ncbi:unnamed protein product [Arabidopsis thaliana]|uniref:(thale cress) hypothetical protein n=1 Tax=Arabidopsis thaliana TaxID=3702 RepID=A0A5S9XX53_ARATH|nr:unnamed protein product [Arabidopsis thaliana]CAD5329493.1 unnamed protein product [Arabidopsis thaliana]
MDKKQDQSEENDLFSNIPLELMIEILLKLPAKSIANLIFVSKHWSSIILDKDFTELYLTRSSTLPRLLFQVSVSRLKMQFLHSSSLEGPSCDHHRVAVTLNHDLEYRFSPPVRGLICCLNGTKVLIGNPSTGEFVTLPKLKTKKRFIDRVSFFGYDPVNDLYKVLCITQLYVHFIDDIRIIRTEEHQVFTLGAKQEWRMIECKHHHYLADPEKKGICMDGVVYYVARINHKLLSLISFNLRSEEFNVIKFPKDVKHIWSSNLVNYNGKIDT